MDISQSSIHDQRIGTRACYPLTDASNRFRFESGLGKCVIDGNNYMVKEGDVIIVPAGAKHNVINTGKTGELKMYTIYGPPNHQVYKRRCRKNG